MKIKSITIQGFKSFVDRTRFHFPMGTSAIVGPNGCGKSNIVDAIRWVLGEQNARHLRGKLMEDLIFTGSDTRKPVGMAEVTLTLSNEDANAPARYANFPEIEIQRRLYRSGESEYLINKVPSRLKDIVDLFTDTGIGTRAYSIIEQGQVGWLVTAKPEERRALFEEAAGINKFKIKKDAALRRLEATRTNLTRVADITSEVKRQLNSLNRQAKKAERYAAIKDELKGLELGLMHARYSEMKGELREKTTSLTALTDLEASCSAEAAKKEALSEEILSGHTGRDEEFKAARERSYEAEGRIREKERSEELSRLRVDELKRTAERLASEIQELKAEKDSTETEAKALSAEVEETCLSLSREEERLREKEGCLDEFNQSLDSTQGELRSEEASKLEINSRLTEARHSIQGCLNEEDALLLTLGKASSEREGLEKRLEENQAPLSSLRGDLEQAGNSKDSLASDFEEARKRLTSLEAESTAGEEKLKTFKEELAAKNSRLKTLEEMARNLEGVRGGAKAILKNGNGSAADQNIHGIHGLIADVIDASPGCEKAVEAVLGERLECVVVESQREGIEAVEYLKTHASGRGSFVPITDPRHPERFNAEALGRGNGELDSTPIDDRPAPEGTTRLINHVEVKSCYRPVVKQLLGGVLLVDDFQQALSIWMSNGISDTLVTPDGETIDPGGVITGGYSNGSDGGLLRKRREITELKDLVASMEASYSTLSQESAESRTKAERLKTLTEGLTGKLHAMDIDRVRKANELKLHADEELRLGERLGTLSEEIRFGEDRLAALATKKLEVSREREALEEKLTASATRVSELSEKLQGLRRESGLLTEELTEIKVSFASVKQGFQHAKEKLRTKEAHGTELLQRIEAKTTEIEASKKEAFEKEGEADSHRTELEGLLTGLDVLKRDVVLKEEALSELREDLDKVDAELRVLKKKSDGLHEDRGTLGVELKGLELELENLSDKAVERYGVSIDTYLPPAAAIAAATDSGGAGTDPDPDLDQDQVQVETDDVSERVSELRERIGKLGEVSLSALEEFNELKGRHAFLEEQKEDLERSMESIRNAITRINRTTREKFKKTFEAINEEFKKNFPRFFSGGKAELRLSGEGDILEQGVEIVAQPPGKRLQNIMLLSGGEKALTATALIFSIFLIKPSPFCLLDEVDAPLDDANIDRFNGFVREMAEKSQFILITHNKRTMEMVDTLFGITMEEPGVSKSVSVQL